MLETFTVPSHSYFRAEVGDLVLRETSTTRLVFRAEIVNNSSHPEASVHGQLIHQRKRPSSGEWQDDDSFQLRVMRSGESVNLNLDADATRNLFLELQRIYAVPLEWGMPRKREWISIDPDEVYIAKGQAKQALEMLMAQDEEALLSSLELLLPDVITNVALKREHLRRSAIVEEYREHMNDGDWSEPDWQSFFRRNTWIFGFNLHYQILTTIENEAHLGGTTLGGRGGQDVDFLLNTEAEARFTVVVDIKKPETELVGNRPYRNKVYPLGADLTGGVSQLQSYCRTWVKEGSEQEANAQYLREENIFTYEPKGILVVGHSGQPHTQDKRATFELFRRNLHNPQIITYDELFARAYFAVYGKAPIEYNPRIPRKYQD